MMKSGNIYLLLTTLVFFLSGCDKESKLSPTENLGLVDMFSPDENADPRVKAMYNDYGVWVRTHFNSIDELTNAILAQDAFVAIRGAENMEEEKIPYYEITGETSKEKRQQLVKDFNAGDVPVFLISLKAGGVGLNLAGADVVIHYDPWWNQAVQNQATDRAHRIGQTKKVTVYKLIAKGSIEEKIQKLQETKKDLADQIIGGESVQLGNMSREDMLELLDVK